MSAAWLGVAAAAFLSSCGMQQVVDALAEPVPRRLDSDPRTTGLLVVDVAMKQAPSGFSLDNSVRLSSVEIRRPGTNKPITQDSLRARLVVFQLSPGTYELRSVWGTRRQQHADPVYAFLPRGIGPTAVEVAAGEIAYVGRLTITSRGFDRLGDGFGHEWDRDRAREAEALAFIEQVYRDSPWAPILRRRLER